MNNNGLENSTYISRPVNRVEGCAPESVSFLLSFLVASDDWVETVAGTVWQNDALDMSIAIPDAVTLAVLGRWDTAVEFFNFVTLARLAS